MSNNFSPIMNNEEDFEALGQYLKRQNVAIDVVNFAHPENVQKLQTLVRTAASGENSHFLDVPIGVSMITDVLIASPIISMDDGMGGAAAGAPEGGAAGIPVSGPGASQFQEYGGVDPNLDPELAMALRISLEEERAE